MNFFCTGQLDGPSVGTHSSRFTFRKEWQAANHCPNSQNVIANYTGIYWIILIILNSHYIELDSKPPLPFMCSLFIDCKIVHLQWLMRTVVLGFISFFVTLLWLFHYSDHLPIAIAVSNSLSPLASAISRILLHTVLKISFFLFWLSIFPIQIDSVQ